MISAFGTLQAPATTQSSYFTRACCKAGPFPFLASNSCFCPTVSNKAPNCSAIHSYWHRQLVHYACVRVTKTVQSPALDKANGATLAVFFSREDSRPRGFRFASQEPSALHSVSTSRENSAGAQKAWMKNSERPDGVLRFRILEFSVPGTLRDFYQASAEFDVIDSQAAQLPGSHSSFCSQPIERPVRILRCAEDSSYFFD
jgi:hypothetical protein